MAKAEKRPRRIGATIGFWALVVGMLIALIGGTLARDHGVLMLVLVILGIIIGILNITPRRQVPFLVAVIALVVVGRASFTALDDVVRGLGASLDGIVTYIAALVAPAAVINAVRAVWALAQPGEI